MNRTCSTALLRIKCTIRKRHAQNNAKMQRQAPKQIHYQFLREKKKFLFVSKFIIVRINFPRKKSLNERWKKNKLPRCKKELTIWKAFAPYLLGSGSNLRLLGASDFLHPVLPLLSLLAGHLLLLKQSLLQI